MRIVITGASSGIGLALTRHFLERDAFVAALERYDSSDPINIGTGKEIPMSKLADKIQALLGHEGKIIWDASKPNGQPRRCLDVSLAMTKLNWWAKTNFDTGLAETINWFIGQQK